MTDLDQLAGRLDAATGADAALDAAVAGAFPEAMALSHVSASVEECLSLLREALPGWRWHVGYGASGVLPYAALIKGEARFAAAGPSVPIALLRAILMAKQAGI